MSDDFYRFSFSHFDIVSVVQRVTAWVAGVPVLKLVTETSSSLSNISSSQSNQPIHRPATSSSKSRKLRADSLEDEEMYAKVRKGDPCVRNARQEQELSQLKEGGLCEKHVPFRNAFSLRKQPKAVNYHVAEINWSVLSDTSCALKQYSFNFKTVRYSFLTIFLAFIDRAVETGKQHHY